VAKMTVGTPRVIVRTSVVPVAHDTSGKYKQRYQRQRNPQYPKKLHPNHRNSTRKVQLLLDTSFIWDVRKALSEKLHGLSFKICLERAQLSPCGKPSAVICITKVRTGPPEGVTV